jgi:co-chaperonin GroES (HSP10)
MFDVEALLGQVGTAWTPRDDKVIVLPLLSATPSADGLIVMTDQNRERPLQGIVLTVGPGGTGPETGRPVPVTSTPGELVAFGRYAGLDFEVASPHGLIKVLILRDCEVLLARPAGSYDLIVHEDHPGKMHEVGHVCDLCAPAHDLTALREVAYGASMPASVEQDAEEADASAAIAAERERLRLERQAREHASDTAVPLDALGPLHLTDPV